MGQLLTLCRTLALVLPLGLVGGCIYVPVSPKPDASGIPDIIRLVGDAHSGRPISPGVSKADVQRILGEPARRSLDGARIAYSFRYRRGYWLGFVGIGPMAAGQSALGPFYMQRWYTFRFDFGPDDRLISFVRHQNDKYPLQLGGADMGALDLLLPEAGSETLIPEFHEWQEQRRRAGFPAGYRSGSGNAD
jgi:hypothetical protein